MNDYDVGLLTIATGKYIKFLPGLYSSVNTNFLKNNNISCYLFTDDIDAAKKIIPESRMSHHFFHIERMGFPGDTLYRYRHFASLDEKLASLGLAKPDFLFYSDADMLVVNEVGQEILPEEGCGLVATAHPGFYLGKTPEYPLGTPESRQQSKAFIDPRRYRPCYVAGGFNGGAYDAFLAMSKEISTNIDDDRARDLIAVWHDESHLNEYVTRPENLKNLKIMSPAYCFAQYNNPNEVGYPAKIVALDKNHAEVRS
jgi:hypothetical protein